MFIKPASFCVVLLLLCQPSAKCNEDEDATEYCLLQALEIIGRAIQIVDVTMRHFIASGSFPTNVDDFPMPLRRKLSIKNEHQKSRFMLNFGIKRNGRVSFLFVSDLSIPSVSVKYSISDTEEITEPKTKLIDILLSSDEQEIIVVLNKEELAPFADFFKERGLSIDLHTIKSSFVLPGFSRTSKNETSDNQSDQDPGTERKMDTQQESHAE